MEVEAMRFSFVGAVVVAASLALCAVPGCKDQKQEDAKKAEIAAKAKAEADAKAAKEKAEAEAKAKAEAEAKAAEEAKAKAEAEAKAAEEAKAKAEAEAKAKAEEEAKAKAEAEAKAAEEARVKAEAEARAKGTELVDKAIAAAGGLDALKAKLSAYALKSKGTYLGLGYEMTTYWKAPGKMIMDIVSVRHGGMAMASVDAECWTRMGGIIVDCSAQEKSYWQMTLWGSYLMTGYALKDEGMVATYKGDGEFDGKKVALVEITKDGAPGPVTFAFDQETGLIMRQEFQGAMGGVAGPVSIRVPGYVDVEGIKVPQKSAMYFQDKLVMDDEFVSATFGAVDDAAFAKPAQVAAGATQLRPVVEHQVVFALHKGPYEALGATIGKVYGCIGGNQLTPLSGPLMVYLKDPMQTKNPEEYETEVQVDVAPTTLTELAGEGCAVKTVPACEVAARVEFGPYQKASEKYGELAGWVKKHGRKIAGPAMMATYNDPSTTPPEGLISELMFVVTK
jgi:effector-binding domain-containing protein